jgi:hypothetical protein
MLWMFRKSAFDEMVREAWQLAQATTSFENTLLTPIYLLVETVRIIATFIKL